MRLRIETSGVKFRVAAMPTPRQVSRNDKSQRTTPDGRLVWTVRLTAIDTNTNRSETIWVEVAGDEPKLTLDELAQVHELVYDPYVNRQTQKIMRAFRAESVTTLVEARKPAVA